jgi:alkylhydroperoxidase family enzyme
MTKERSPRVEAIATDSASEELRPTFDALIAERGKVPNLYRITAHAPEIMRTLLAHQRAVMGTGNVPVLLKELLSVRVSRINLCDY